jgi:rod shape-determining protein MreC
MNLSSKSIKYPALIFIVFFLIFFLHYTKILYPVEKILITVTKPVMRVFLGASSYVGENYLEFMSKKDLLAENKELKDQLAMLLKEKNRFLTEKEENEFLREQLSFVQTTNYEYSVANVVGKNISEIENSLVLDIGANKGVKIGQPVLGPQGVLIGKITKVESDRSYMLFINDDLSRLAVKIFSATKTMGIVEGQFGLGLKMKLIPRTENISEGDLVVTSGLEEFVPANIVVGQIERVTNDAGDLFQEASIESPINFNKITLVNVVTTK